MRIAKDIILEITPVNKYNFDEIICKTFANTNVKTRPLYNVDGEIINNFVELVREDDESFITVVSEKYDITQHEDYIIPFMKKLLEYPNTNISLLKQNEDNHNRMACKIISDEVIIKNQIYNKLIIIANSSDASAGRRILAGIMRFACSNMSFSGLPVAVGIRKHVKGLNNEIDHEEEYKLLSERIDEEINKMIKFITLIDGIPLEDYDRNNFVDEILVKQGIVPKTLIYNTKHFFEIRNYIMPRTETIDYFNITTLFELYQLIIFWASNQIYRTDINRGLNYYKLIHKAFIDYLIAEGLILSINKGEYI